MKKLAVSILCACMVSSMLIGCGGGSGSTATSEVTDNEVADNGDGETAEGGSSKDSSHTINVWAFTDEVPGMIEKYIETHPDFGYDINTTIIATTDGAYQPALDQALASGGAEAPDIYCAEAAFVLKYTQGDASQY